MFVETTERTKESVGTLVRLNSQSVRSSHDGLAVELKRGHASLLLSAEANVGRARIRVLTEERHVGDGFLNDCTQGLISVEQLHDMLLLEVVRQLVHVKICESLSLRRTTVTRGLTLRLGQLLVLSVITSHDQSVRVRFHVAVVPSGNAKVGSLTAIEIDERKSLRVMRILVDYNLKNGKSEFIISTEKKYTVEFTYDCAQNEVVETALRVNCLFFA